MCCWFPGGGCWAHVQGYKGDLRGDRPSTRTLGPSGRLNRRGYRQSLKAEAGVQTYFSPRTALLTLSSWSDEPCLCAPSGPISSAVRWCSRGLCTSRPRSQSSLGTSSFLGGFGEDLREQVRFQSGKLELLCCAAVRPISAKRPCTNAVVTYQLV